jgi:xanthine dehydrogenase accessory factor
MSAADRLVLGEALDWLEEGRRAAIATVIQTWGSAPVPVGGQLVVDEDGQFLGSVSGGCVEGEVIAEAAEVLASGQPKLLQFGVEDSTAWRAGLACGGSIRVYIAPVVTAASVSSGILRQIIDELAARRPVALVTQLVTGDNRLVRSADALGEEFAPLLEAAFRNDKSTVIESGGGEIFINVFNPPIRLVVVGAVHVAQALVPMARAVGYELAIVDPRSGFATEARFGEVTVMADWPDEALAKIGLDARTAVVALAHDAKIDDPALISALRSDAFYIGALGSRKTHAKRVERLLQAGIDPADTARIHAPIGLDIGAQGAAEIALSIIAEITAVRRGKAQSSRA